MAILVLASTASAEVALSPQPVESLGGNPVYGAAMPRDGVVVPIAKALSEPDAYLGSAGKFSGMISEVCQRKGCWVVLADGPHHVRVTFKDYGFVVPTDASGEALVFGMLQEATVDLDAAEHLAEEGDRHAPAGGGSEYRIVARSIMIKAD